MTISTPCRLWGDLAPIQPLAAWGTAEAPPKEFLVFKFGQNHATLGGRREVVTLTPKRANAIVAEWKRRRISGAFDYEHAVTEKNPNGTPAAGWFSLAVRADGLWAVGITWTDRALSYFKGKEYRYFSPYFGTNSAGEVTTLYNIALTNWPATDQQRPLIALSRAMRRYTMEPLSIEQLKAKAQELIDTFSAKGELMDLVLWLDAFQRGGAPIADPLDPNADPLMTDASTTPSADETTIAQSAYKAFGTTNTKEVLAHFKQFTILENRAKTAEGELRNIKHTAAVEAALKAGKITPAQKDAALADDPDEFRIAMKYANSVRDDEVLTPNTRLAKTEQPPTLDEIKKDKNVLAWVNKSGLNLETYAQSWAKTKAPLSLHPTIE